MIEQIRYIWQLLVLSSILLVLGIPRLGIDLEINQFIATLISVTGINLMAWIVMSLGMKKSNRGGMVVLLAGIGFKFLLYLLYILVFWAVIKILTKPFIITFFALYLVFTIFLGAHLIKMLKND